MTRQNAEAVDSRDPATEAAPASTDLLRAWAGKERCVVVATGVDAVGRLLDIWQRWCDDPARSARLTLIGIVPDLDAAAIGLPTRSYPHHRLAERLAAAWPVATPGLHAVDFEAGRVSWLLAAGTAAEWLRKLRAGVDAWWLGAEVASEPDGVFRGLARLSADGARLVAEALPSAAVDRLGAVGFAVEMRESASVGVYAPRFRPRPAPRGAVDAGAGRRTGGRRPRVLVAGAGLAGCASAWALAEQGYRCTLFERRPRIAEEASGNVAGLFHGVVHAGDGPHARFNRAAALTAATAVDVAIARHGVRGSTAGALRLETRLTPSAMRALLAQMRLPPGYVQALDRAEASACAGIELAAPAWFYPRGGWVEPAGLARSFLERAGGDADVRTVVDVRRLERTPGGWSLLDADGRAVDEAPTLVLANAGDALRLLAPFGDLAWPVEAVRGQLAMLAVSELDFALPARPVAGAGYLLPEIDGLAVFGASADRGDWCGEVRPADHAANLERLGRLLGRPAAVGVERMRGRTAWRWSSRDRLPLVGGVPDAAAIAEIAAAAQRMQEVWRGGRPGHRSAQRLDHIRAVPRLPGLFVFTALGSRGIAWAALGAQVLAAQVAGAPVPLEAGLLDAIDPARFAVRDRRRSGGVAEAAGVAGVAGVAGPAVESKADDAIPRCD